MPDRSLYADLAPIAGPRRTPRPAAARPRQHTPIRAPRTPAAQAQAIGRLTHAGGPSGKRIAFNASV
jgi:hypothetical protein